MIELTCPKCKSPLEIDDGFRGGVCRCFSCGTLMTVPDEPAAGRAESLTESAPIQMQGPAAVERGRTFTTRSGKTVQLSSKQTSMAPVARRPRKSVRVAVTAAVLAVAVLLMAGVGVLAYVLFRPPPAAEQADAYADLFDIEQNPFTWTEPNFMGLPAGKANVMLIDSSAAMRHHLDIVKAAVLASLATLGPDRKAQVIFWSEEQPWAYPDQMTPAGNIDRQSLRTAMAQVSASGAPAPEPALAIALEQQPEQITIVARALPNAEQATALADRLKRSKVRLFVVHLDAVETDPDAAAWNKAAKATGGVYAGLNSARLRRWYEESLDQ